MKHLSLFDSRLTVNVVGVVRDIPPPVPDQAVEPEIYWSNRQEPRPFSYFIIRTSGPSGGITASVRARLRAIDRDLSANNVESLDGLLNSELRAPRFHALLVVAFSAAGMALAAIGTYGLFAYLISRRTRELGIRIALGAERRQIIGDVLADGLKLAGLGVLIGTACSMLLVTGVRSMIAGVSSFDPLSLVGSAVLLIIGATVACLAPARRAARVDPGGYAHGGIDQLAHSAEFGHEYSRFVFMRDRFVQDAEPHTRTQERSHGTHTRVRL